MRQLTKSPSVVVELETGCLCGSRLESDLESDRELELSRAGRSAWWLTEVRKAKADLLFSNVDLDDLEVAPLKTLLKR